MHPLSLQLFWRPLIKIPIGQFFMQKHLNLCLTHTLTHADVNTVTLSGPVVTSLVWFLVSCCSFR